MFRAINPPTQLSLETTGPIFKSEKPWKSALGSWADQGQRHGNGDVYEEKGRRRRRRPLSSLLPTASATNVGSTFRRSIASVVLKHVAVFLLAISPLAGLAMVLMIPRWQKWREGSWDRPFQNCNPNGVFTPYNHMTYNIWNGADFFYINCAWGDMSFQAAKAVDIAWDIAVGGGGQTLLAWITYKVSTKWLTKTMESAPVSYTTFESLAFTPPSFLRAWNIVPDIRTSRVMKARLTLIWIILSSLFVLSFSTLIAAMSGYNTNTFAAMQTYDGELVPWNEYQVIQFGIHDAERVGEPAPVSITADHFCVWNGPRLAATISPPDSSSSSSGDLGTTYRRGIALRGDDDDDDVDDHSEDDAWSDVPPNCTLFWRTVQCRFYTFFSPNHAIQLTTADVDEYGLHGANQISSEFYNGPTEYDLQSPTLDITTSFNQESFSALAGYFNGFPRNDMSVLHKVSDISPGLTVWTYDNQTYSWAYVMENAACLHSGTHNWGFSFLILFITTLLLAIWSIGTYALWLDTYLHSRVDREKRDMGVYRASWDLVDAMRHDLGPDAIYPQMGNGEIREQVQQRRRRTSPPTDLRGMAYPPGPSLLPGPEGLKQHDGPSASSSPSSSYVPSPSSPLPPLSLTRWQEFKIWWHGTSPGRKAHEVRKRATFVNGAAMTAAGAARSASVPSEKESQRAMLAASPGTPASLLSSPWPGTPASPWTSTPTVSVTGSDGFFEQPFKNDLGDDRPRDDGERPSFRNEI